MQEITPRLRLFPAGCLVVLMLCANTPAASAPRSQAARAEFQRTNPCPATDARRGPCPGHVIDHITPLCAGGADAPYNMQWQTVADAKLKDRAERAMCRR